MPSNLLKLSSSSMESDFYHNRFERSESFDSQGSHRSRSRSSTLDDENLKHLTNEEKNALMFLEETLGAFEDEEESAVPHESSLGYYSARSTEDSQSDNDDIIDLVQNEHNGTESSLGSAPVSASIDQNRMPHDSLPENPATYSATSTLVLPVEVPHQNAGSIYSEPISDHPKQLLGAIPTPVIIAQKISEKKPDNAPLALMLPKDEKLPELKKSVATSPISDNDFAFLTSPAAKFSQFPNNISIKRAGKEYNKTIAKAAVNVPERRAKVLANLHGPGAAEEVDGKAREPVTRKTSFREVPPEQARYMALTKLGLINEAQVQADLRSTNGTSPVSNGVRSPTFAFPDSQRRNSNEYAKNNSLHPLRVLAPDVNTKVSHEHHVMNSNQSLSPPESSRRLSNDQYYYPDPFSPKPMSPESNKKGPHEQHFVVVPQPPKIPPTAPSKKISHEPHVIHSQQPVIYIPSEPLKKMHDEQHPVSPQSAKYLHSEVKTGPSKSQHLINGQFSTKSLPSESKKTHSNEQESISSYLTSAPSSFVPLGKTVVIKGDLPTSPDKRQLRNSIHVPEEKPVARQEVKRTYSMPRPTGFRPQGITVQFSGRNSSEEDRKSALRMLGLLKDEYRP